MSPELFLKLSSLGLSTEQMAGVLKVIQEADEGRKEGARARWRKWKDGQTSVSQHEQTLANADKRLTGAEKENKQTNKQDLDTSPAARSNRGTRIPEDFIPDRGFALSQGLSPSEAETEDAQFIDFWSSKPGKDGQKLDWPATWRTWVRNAVKRQTPRRSQSPPKKVNMWIAEGRERGILNDPANTPDRRLEAGHGGGSAQSSNLARRITIAGTG